MLKDYTFLYDFLMLAIGEENYKFTPGIKIFHRFHHLLGGDCRRSSETYVSTYRFFVFAVLFTSAFFFFSNFRSPIPIHAAGNGEYNHRLTISKKLCFHSWIYYSNFDFELNREQLVELNIAIESKWAFHHFFFLIGNFSIVDLEKSEWRRKRIIISCKWLILL